MSEGVLIALITAIGSLIGGIIGNTITASATRDAAKIKEGIQQETQDNDGKSWSKILSGAFAGAILTIIVLYLFGFFRLAPLEGTESSPTKTPATSTPISVYLSEINYRTAIVGSWEFSIGKYNFTSTDATDKVQKGDPIMAHGVEYPHGLYAHAPSKITYNLNKQYSELLVTIALVDWIQCGDGAVFVIKLDGDEIYRSKNMTYYSSPENVKIDITNGNLLELITEATNGNNECDWAIWGDPILH